MNLSRNGFIEASFHHSVAGHLSVCPLALAYSGMVKTASVSAGSSFSGGGTGAAASRHGSNNRAK